MISSFSEFSVSPAIPTNSHIQAIGVSLIDSYGRYIYVDHVYAALWHITNPVLLEGDSIFEHYFDSTSILDLIGHADLYGFSLAHMQAKRGDGSSFSVGLRIEALVLDQSKLYLCSVYDQTSGEHTWLFDQQQDLSFFSSPGVSCALFLLVPHPHYALEVGFVSHQISELCGISLTELQEGAIAFLRRVHPEDRNRLLERLSNSQQQLERSRLQFRYHHPNKGLIWLEAFLWPQEAESANLHLFCFVQDITLQIMHSIRQNLSQLQVESDMVFTLGPDFRIAEVNAAVRHVFRILGDSLIGRDFAAILPYIDQVHSLEQVQQYLQQDGFWKTSFYQRGSALVLLLRRSVELGARADRPLKPSQTLLAPQVNGLSRFAGGLAHNLNNLLMIVLGYSELIQAQISSNETIYRDLQHIRMAGDQMRVLVNQLLAFGGMQDLFPSPSDIEQLLFSIERDLRQTLPSTIELRFQFQPHLPLAYIDESKLEYVLSELISNACYAMNNSGTIDFSLRRLSSQDFALYDLPPQIDESFLVLRISDTGRGMNLETQRQAFEPFFTTKELGEGMGLGLAMVYGIIHQSGGAIVLESSPNEGTSVVIFLPSLHTYTKSC